MPIYPAPRPPNQPPAGNPTLNLHLLNVARNASLGNPPLPNATARDMVIHNRTINIGPNNKNPTPDQKEMRYNSLHLRDGSGTRRSKRRKNKKNKKTERRRRR